MRMWEEIKLGHDFGDRSQPNGYRRWGCARTTATLVRTERASHVRVTGGICVNQASKPTTGIAGRRRGKDAG